jgi:hypothetical protein
MCNFASDVWSGPSDHPGMTAVVWRPLAIAAHSPQHALFASLAIFALSIVTSAAFLSWMRRAVV